MPTVVLLGTLDTKGADCAFVRDRLRDAGIAVLTVDTGILGTPAFAADIAREAVARAAGHELAALAAAGDRGAAIAAMAAGAEAVLLGLRREGRLDGAMALGGGGGSTLAARAFRALPLGVPKLIVSTMASGDTSGYVGESDLMLMPSVVDVAGVNRISARILANAAAAMAGMVSAAPVALPDARPVIAASMFGVTTPAVTEGRRLLEAAGYEVLTFHMTGVGGRTLESLVGSGLVAGVLDLTTTELADELVGGVLSAGPVRLAVRGDPPVPRVVSVGALDMVNFGPRDTVPARFAGRRFHVHNANVTLMRTTPEECATLGKRLAERVAALGVPATLLLPLRGISAIDVPGAAFHDPEADAALFGAIRAHLDRSRVGLVDMDTDINDPAFAAGAVAELRRLMGRVD